MGKQLQSLSLLFLFKRVEGKKGLGALKGVPSTKLPSCAGVAPSAMVVSSQPWTFWGAGGGPTTVSIGTTAARKRGLVSLASEIQLLGGRLILLMGSGSLLIILLIYRVGFFVSIKGYICLLKQRSTFVFKQVR